MVKFHRLRDFIALCPTWETYIAPFPSRLRNLCRNGSRKIVKAEEPWDVYRMQCFMNTGAQIVIIMGVVAFMRPTQIQARKHISMTKGGRHDTPGMLLELMALDCFCKSGSQLS